MIGRSVVATPSNRLYLALSLIALLYGLGCVLLPRLTLELIFPNPPGPEAHILIQGWGACLLAFSVLAWGARQVSDVGTQRLISSALTVYFAVAAVVWLLDALGRGWSPLSALTLALLAVFAASFGALAARRETGATGAVRAR
jgi:uncharacterized protein YjeT (DUF2065 family)